MPGPAGLYPEWSRTRRHAPDPSASPVAMDSPTQENAFTIGHQGDVTIITVSPVMESIDPFMVEGASTLILESIRSIDGPPVLFDLSRIAYFGSAFLALMLRCWKHVSARGGTMALTGVSATARDLLRMTALDTVWPIYDTRAEALEALLSD